MIYLRPPHAEGGKENHGEADDGKRVGDLREEREAEERGENDIRVVIYGYRARLGVAIGSGDAELPKRRARTCADEYEHLREGHWPKVDSSERQRREARKSAEEISRWKSERKRI